LKEKLVWGLKKSSYRPLRPKINNVTFSKPLLGEEMVEKFEKRMMNFNELADYIGLRPQTIRNKFYAGEFPIPAKKIFAKVLWDKKDVDKYLDKLPKIDC
jgi:predicted DNA-binding transcriptional regulator AlpA